MKYILILILVFGLLHAQNVQYPYDENDHTKMAPTKRYVYDPSDQECKDTYAIDYDGYAVKIHKSYLKFVFTRGMQMTAYTTPLNTVLEFFPSYFECEQLHSDGEIYSNKK